MKLDETQHRAVELCLDTSKRLVGISGEAGTGKTTIMKATCDELTRAGYRVAISAPTGRAAKRAEQLTGYPAQTNHKLLEYPMPGEVDEETGEPLEPNLPRRNKFNRLEFDVLLVDEYAMVNQEINRALIDALPVGGCIRAFGDHNQLPPIETDKAMQKLRSPFNKILEDFSGVRLEVLYRQETDSGIYANAHRILQGRVPKRYDDYDMRITDYPVRVLKEIVEGDMFERDIDWGDFQHQIIVPSNVTWVGTDKVNRILQSSLRDKTERTIELPRHKWSKFPPIQITPGDKVIITRNNYDIGVFNGEIGNVMDTYAGDVIIQFEDEKTIMIPTSMEVKNRKGQKITIDPRTDIDLAFAITTHKSQGSEYVESLYMVNKANWFVQGRANFYTATTRSRRMGRLIADSRSLANSVRPERERE